jgi:hypothetical protein
MAFHGGTIFLKFDIEYWKELFKEGDYPSITIVPCLAEVVDETLMDKEIIIVADTKAETVTPTMDRVRDNNGHWVASNGLMYEARVIMGMYAELILNRESLKVCVGLAMGMDLISTGFRRETMYLER